MGAQQPKNSIQELTVSGLTHLRRRKAYRLCWEYFSSLLEQMSDEQHVSRRFAAIRRIVARFNAVGARAIDLTRATAFRDQVLTARTDSRGADPAESRS